MQKVAYICDQCKKEIGNKKHLSISFGTHSGVANPPNTPIGEKKDVYFDSWTTRPAFLGKFVHFCSVGCSTLWFTSAMKSSEATL